MFANLTPPPLCGYMCLIPGRENKTKQQQQQQKPHNVFTSLHVNDTPAVLELLPLFMEYAMYC